MEDKPQQRGRGRPAGTKDVKPRAQRRVREKRTAERIATVNKLLPLDLMISRMMKLWNQQTDESEREAISIAKEAAPYIHAKLSSVEARVKHEDLRQVDDAVLIAELSMLNEQHPELTPGEIATLASSPAEPRH